MLVAAYTNSEFVPSIHHCSLFRCDLGDCVNHLWRNSVCCSYIVSPATTDFKEIRVRFAPSPTGILHVGGARTALFNYLFARSKGGKLILRIEDTDLERSNKESEDSILRDLSWLDLQWDEGPDVGGNYGPYRQSERNHIYHHHLDRLMKLGHVYRCFYSDEELDKMKEVAIGKQMPTIYSRKWANASETEIQREIDKGTPCVYRFRVPRGGQRLEIKDLIRGKVSWNLDTIEDFVIMRSNGQPVYNFCVTVDDHTMAISHVIRAEEHLSNTLRQALIYKVLGFQMPNFAHVPLILALDKSKLSKRHGATSVGQLREMGYLPQAIVNYLALLGWGDGTATQFFSINMLVKRFSLSRVNKSGTIFDPVKMRWMNGRYLRSLPEGELTELIGRRWESVGLLSHSSGQFFKEAVELVKGRINVVSDADQILRDILSFPLLTTLSSVDNIKLLIENGVSQVRMKLLDAYDNGELPSVVKGDGISEWKAWVNRFGNSLNRKGKAFFIPLRVLMTGRIHGPDMGYVLSIVDKAGCCDVICEGSGFVNMENRFEILKEVNWDKLVPPTGCT